MDMTDVPDEISFGRDIALVTKDNKIIEANKEAKSVLGGELIGKSVPFFDKKLLKTISSAKGSMNIDKLIAGRIYDVSIYPSQEDREEQILTIIARDITVQKEEEDELRTLKKAVESCSCGVTIADAQKKDMPIIYANKAFTELTGYEEEEILGKNCRTLQRGDRDQKSIAEIRNAIDAGKKVTTRVRNYRKNGEMFWNELRLAPVKHRDKITHYVGIQTDVTHIVERERHRAQSYCEK